MRQVPSVSLIVLMLLSACGGSSSSLNTGIDDSFVGEDSSGGDDGDTTLPDPYPVNFPEFWGLEAANVSAAHDAGYFGSSVTIAIFDDGLSSHPEFADQIIGGYNAAEDTEDGSAIINHDCTGYEGDCDTGTHGTYLAGVIAAKHDDEGVSGVAPEVSLFSVNIDTSADDGYFLSADFTSAKAWEAAIESGAQIFNHSYGTDFNEFLATTSDDLAEQIVIAQEAGIVQVYAAGNSAYTRRGEAIRPEGLHPSLPLYFPEIEEGAVIGVVAVEEDDGGTATIASYSSQCGQSMDWCLSAPSGGVVVGLTGIDDEGVYHEPSDPDQNGLMYTGGGTSGAAAFVSGSLALLIDAFPYLNGIEAGQILLDTAQDLGEEGTDALYGRGLVDIAEAMTPQGELTLADGDDVDGAGAVEDAAIVAGLAVPLRNALAGQSLVFFDKLGRAFPMDAEALIQEQPTLQRDIARLSSLLHGMEHASSLSESSGLAFASKAQTGEWKYGFAGTASIKLDRKHSLSFGTASHGASPVGAASKNGLQAVLNDEGAIPFVSITHGEGGFLSLMPSETAGSVSRFLSEKLKVSVSLGFGEDTARTSFEMARRLSPKTAIGLRIGSIEEDLGLLGTQGFGAFDFSDPTQSGFIEASLIHTVSPRLMLSAEAGIGRVFDHGDNRYLSFSGPLYAASAHIGVDVKQLVFKHRNDQMNLRLGIPLHAISGEGHLTLPTARLADGSISYSDQSFDLNQGTPLELSLGYHLDLGDGLRLGATGNAIKSSDDEIDTSIQLGGRIDLWPN